MATALQLDFFQAETHAPHAHELPYIGTCTRCHTTARQMTPVQFKTCASVTCNATVTYRQVQGTYNPAVKCDARCMGATGPVCQCSCGGKNHGGRA